jgi:hypothetical protein
VERERDTCCQVIKGIFCSHILDDREFDICLKLFWQRVLDVINLGRLSHNSPNRVTSLKCRDKGVESDESTDSGDLLPSVCARDQNQDNTYQN